MHTLKLANLVLFLSTLSLRRATVVPCCRPGRAAYFYPRSPCGERPSLDCNRIYKDYISIHALLAESDQLYDTYAKVLRVFLSTLSLRRATWTAPCSPADCGYFYPRSPCGERRGSVGELYLSKLISIHALLAESDRGIAVTRIPTREFLSTLSLRRATSWVTNTTTSPAHFYPRSPCGERPKSEYFDTAMAHFYPRSPCGERQTLIWDVIAEITISIHALLAESDGNTHGNTSFIQIFLSTLSLRRATPHSRDNSMGGNISIHALLAESDLTEFCLTLEGHNFYPRSPCGERRFYPFETLIILAFLSTLSLRRATGSWLDSRFCKSQFLSTLSLRRATPPLHGPRIGGPHFYPRSPCGERRINAR